MSCAYASHHWWKGVAIGVERIEAPDEQQALVKRTWQQCQLCGDYRLRLVPVGKPPVFVRRYRRRLTWRSPGSRT